MNKRDLVIKNSWKLLTVFALCYFIVLGHGTKVLAERNSMEVNKEYSFSQLTPNSTNQNIFELVTNIETAGRIAVEIVDCNVEPNSYIQFETKYQSSYKYASRKWLQYTDESYGCYWLSVYPGSINIDIRLDSTPNSEAKVIVRYQSIEMYNGELEDNDTFDTANVITTDVEYSGNKGYGADDIDMYKFTMQKNGLAQLSINSEEKISEVSVYEEDSYGNVAEIIKESGNNISLRLRLPKGIYYIKIRVGGDHGCDYKLCANVNYESENAFEQEKNNVRSQANKKETNVTYTGNLNNEEDVDYYQFTVSKKSYLKMEFRVPRQSNSGMWEATFFKDDEEIASIENTENPYYATEEALFDAGTYYIRVKWGTGLSYSAADYSICLCQREFVEPASITVEPTKSMKIGETAILVATVNPTNTDEKDVKWESSNSGIVSVDSNGKLTAKKVGTAIITVQSTYNSSIKASCKVTVNPIPVESIQLSATKKSMSVGQKITLKATIVPSNATYPTVTWKSSNSKVVSVDKKGKLTAKKCGTATITVTATKDKVNATCKVTVVPAKQKISSYKNNKSKKVTLKWKKDTKAKGYQIDYSTDKKFKKGVKTVTIKKNTTTTKTISKLKKGKTYYFRIRAYGESGGKKLYGAYSSKVKVKIKK